MLVGGERSLTGACCGAAAAGVLAGRRPTLRSPSLHPLPHPRYLWSLRALGFPPRPLRQLVQRLALRRAACRGRGRPRGRLCRRRHSLLCLAQALPLRLQLVTARAPNPLQSHHLQLAPSHQLRCPRGLLPWCGRPIQGPLHLCSGQST